MAAPAISAALLAVIAKLEAITPTLDPGKLFRRRAEKAPPTTLVKRGFDVQFQGHPRDRSNEGDRDAVQNPGLADRVATFTFEIAYAKGNVEKALETTMAVDSELLLRALGRSASWAGTPVRRVVARSAVLRLPPDELQPGEITLVVSADIHYRDSE